MKHTQLPDNKLKIYGGAWSVHDQELVDHRNYFLQDFQKINLSDTKSLQQLKINFFEMYKQWMFADFDFPGQDLYTNCCFTQGTTESFYQYYLRYGRHGRLRLYRGEYFFHQMMKNLQYVNNFAGLDEDEIRPGDFVLISVPFSDTGDVPEDLEHYLTQCDIHRVPVMLDLAYINLTNQAALSRSVDLSHDCIEYVVSSLSKAFPTEHYRIGIRLQKKKFEDQLYVINEDNYNYLNFCSMYVGYNMMNSYPAKIMFDRYRSQQIKLCNELELEVSPCYTFGIDTKNQYSQYNRGRSTNRLCFSRIWDNRSANEGLEK